MHLFVSPLCLAFAIKCELITVNYKEHENLNGEYDQLDPAISS